MIELWDDPAYRHMLFNHVPIIGLALALVVLVTGVALRQVALQVMGLALVMVTAGASMPVATYGDEAYPAIFDTLNGDGRAWLDYHVDVADTLLPVLYLNAVVAMIALVIAAVRRKLLLPAALVVSLATVAGLSSAIWIGKAGGRIQHPEFRLDDPPVVESKRRVQ